jgi:hypothetical protein
MVKTYAQTAAGMAVVVKQDAYTRLWSVRYEDGTKYCGPYKTLEEAIEQLPRSETQFRKVG